MLNVDLYNFIPFLTGKKPAPEPIMGRNPEDSLEIIRQSCSNKESSCPKWSRLIREHCLMPSDHPFVRLLQSRQIPSDNPLWTLGAIAFGTETPWIVFNAIHWPDGTKDYPERFDVQWAKSQAIGKR
jgi:hypothetical protein